MQKLLANKKNIIILAVCIIIIVIGIIVIISNSNDGYIIKVSIVDSKSPDRILKVYDSNNKKVEYLEIRYTDDTLLCTSKNPTVYYGDIENKNKIKEIIDDEKEIIAKVVEE